MTKPSYNYFVVMCVEILSNLLRLEDSLISTLLSEDKVMPCYILLPERHSEAVAEGEESVNKHICRIIAQ